MTNDTYFTKFDIIVHYIMKAEDLLRISLRFEDVINKGLIFNSETMFSEHVRSSF